jgi:CheY-like chemotaxis protein
VRLAYPPRAAPGVSVAPAGTEAVATPAAPPATAPPDPRLTSRRLLLADDDAVGREFVADLLQHLGLQLQTVGDGEAAVQAAQQGEFDAILMDLSMPRLGGLDTTRHIRALGRHGRTPIVAITASAFNDDRKHCRAAGMDGFVSKPVDPERLAGLLATLLAAAAAALSRAARSGRRPSP